MHNVNIVTKKIILDENREIIIETGKLAKLADGAAVVKMGDTTLLATVVASREADPNMNFLPLSVDYQEKFASAGKIPGGFLKREGRLSDREVLISRLVDRAIRPMFPKDFHASISVSINLISCDPNITPDILAALAASSAIAVSDIPFLEPISEVRVARIDGNLCINPYAHDIQRSDINLIVAASRSHVIMVEGDMAEISEKEILEAIAFGHDNIIKHCEVQNEFTVAANKIQKREYQHAKQDPVISKLVYDVSSEKFDKIIKLCMPNKKDRKEAIEKVEAECVEKIISDLEQNGQEIDLNFIKKHLDLSYKKQARKFTLGSKKRIDSRKYDQIRDIWTEIDILPRVHGSAVFTRGDTQSLTTVTLGNKLDEQMIDSVVESGTNKFLLHYNFPGFSTGEVKPLRGPARREVGHGNLAYKALKRLIPQKEDNPYTIRVVSDILESNGSSSMATVCASSLALMDSGINFSEPVSGIAMGLIVDKKTGEYAILSDILGDEDFIGDMDFKIAGTAKGITACQMDIKIEGVSKNVIEEALEQARKGRNQILDIMNKTINKPRPDFKPNTPRIESVIIDEQNIGLVIGPGGKVIQEMQKNTNTVITIENENGVGLVKISASNKESIDLAKAQIEGLVAKPEIGQVYRGKVKAILDFGAFVEFLPGKDGLLHISEIMWDRVNDINTVLKIGEEIDIKLLDIDRNGRFKLSRKVLMSKDVSM